MDESSFETFEDELKKPLQENPPQKPVRQTRAEMYTQRRVREEAPIAQQVPKMIPREHPLSSATSLRRALSIQNLSQMQMERPWEGVTLNRCLIVAITILLLSSGLQRIHDAVRGRKEDSEALTVLTDRHTLLRRGKITPQPDSSLWDTLFWWLDDDDDEERSGKHKKVSRSLRHRALPDPRLLKKRKTFTERRGRAGEEEVKETRKKMKAKKMEEEENMEGKAKKDSKKKMKAKKIMEEEEEEGYMEKKNKAKKDSKKSPVRKELKQ
ncbi:uncharacterized protein LOC130214721 [Danio aesculapii]|uniref:uncharacterized protein LOC130214721 n=1 Tax=Danio aesculapii TaxID=1142201 RepID=UPI0024C04177|nr:uncharacterized protein LOC130214721 [Danio aesculapii]XP_056302513.1 uncharacterized protein LOC130214721 [Danio aesculapii]